MEYNHAKNKIMKKKVIKLNRYKIKKKLCKNVSKRQQKTIKKFNRRFLTYKDGKNQLSYIQVI